MSCVVHRPRALSASVPRCLSELTALRRPPETTQLFVPYLHANVVRRPYAHSDGVLGVGCADRYTAFWCPLGIRQLTMALVFGLIQQLAMALRERYV